MSGTNSRIDLTALRAFVALIELEGITAAARAERLPKSTVSRALAALEAEVGQTLVVRSTRSFSATDQGKALAAQCRIALEQVDAGMAAARGGALTPRGTVRVTLPTLLALVVGRAVVPLFLRQHPEVKLQLQCTNRMVDLAAEGIDVAVRVGPLPDAAVTARRLGDVRTALVASPDYLTRRGTPRRAADLERHDCLLFSTGAMSTTWAGGVRVTANVQADDFAALRELSLAGVGIAWLPGFLVDEDLEAGRLQRVLPSIALDGPVVWVAFPGGRQSNAATRVFIDHLTTALAAILREPRVGRTPSNRARGAGGAPPRR